jgi:hypothetical protein
LERLAAGIIRAQGNRFIKELLRSNGITIGATKDEFEANLMAAIHSGHLTLADVETWLAEVEGWGNQHVYLYRISDTLRRQLTPPRIHRKVTEAGFEELWDAPTVLQFPDLPTLTSISFNDSVLRLVWQEASPAWARAEEKDYTAEEGLDIYEYRAWRMAEHRAVTRFDAHLGLKLAGLFVPNPIQGEEHARAVDEAKRVIGLLMDLSQLTDNQLEISLVSRNMDQRNVPGQAAAQPKVKTQRSRLTSGGAYVEFAANASDRAYWEEDAIRGVRRSVRDQQLGQFYGTGGVFLFQPFNGLERELRVQLYGEDNRTRLWAQMKENEVWTILKELNQYA